MKHKKNKKVLTTVSILLLFCLIIAGLAGGQKNLAHVYHSVTSVKWDFIIGDIYNESTLYYPNNDTVNCTHTIIFHVEYIKRVTGIFPFDYTHSTACIFNVRLNITSEIDISLHPNIMGCVCFMAITHELMIPGIYYFNTDLICFIHDYGSEDMPAGQYNFWIDDCFGPNSTHHTSYTTSIKVV